MLTYFLSALLAVFVMFVVPPLLWFGGARALKAARSSALWPRQHDHEDRDANGARW